MKQAGRFLSKYIKRNFGVFAIYMLLCILCSILSLIAPYISGNFIDVLLHIEQREQLVKYCVVFATMSFGSIACNYIISQIFARLRIKMNYEINMDFLHHIRKISILTLQKQTTASITQKLNYDTGIVTSFSLQTLQNMILGAIRYFFGLGKSIQEMQVSLGRLINVMSIEEEKYGKKVIKHIQTIEVNNLDFVLDKRVILKNFSYKFRRGNIYGITGENGAGKSTLMNIITGMYWIPEAPIFINGVPIVKCDLGKMRRTSYGILEQEPILLEESIKDNMFLGGEDKSGSQKFIDITKLLGLDVFLKKLPNVKRLDCGAASD